jgi:PAS domain S-box-containing protein
LTAHAVIRHRLMDVRPVIRQSVTYCLSLVATIAVMWGGLTFVELVPGMQHFGTSTFALFISVGGVVLFHPVRVRMQSLLDRYCFRSTHDYHLATRTISQLLAGLVRFTPLCTSLTAFMRSALGVEMVAVYVVRESTWLTQCALQSTNGDWILPQTVSLPGLLSLLARAGEPVVREELGRWRDSREVKCLTTAFAALHSDVLIPLLVEDHLTALIAVGRKLSGDPFFVHDVEFLDTVGYQASVALRRAQLYEEIAWMKEYNETILRQMVSGVIAVSQHGEITMVNAAAACLVGVVAEAVVGRVVTESLPAALCTPLQQTLADGTTCTNEEATLTLTAERKLPIALSTSVLHGAAGEQIGALLVFHDLSRLKELEEEKHRIERLAAIGTFVAGIAHEIKNPLVAIKTLAELLPEQYDDDEFRTTFTRVALHEVDRIDSLVHRLRSLGSSSPLQMRPINALTPLDETLALISGELVKCQVTLKYDKTHPLPSIVGDHDQLKQVFLNLCLNSLEAMEQQGTLHIAVDIEAAQDDMPAMLRIQICDTGPGIPAEYFPTIFEPFVTSKATGSGLGLAICQGIIEQHRGTIAAANRRDGAGAIFTIRLPIAKEEEPYEIAAPVHRDTRVALAVA